MSYKIALFLHVSGALLLAGVMAIEWIDVIQIRKADIVEKIQDSVLNYANMNKIGGPAMILIIITGFYMAAKAWRGPESIWMVFGFIGLLLLGAIGGMMTGRKISKVRKMIKKEKSISKEAGILQNDRSIWVSIRLRTAIFLGIIFLMTVQPGLLASILTLVISIILGFIPVNIKANTVTNSAQELRN